MAMTMASAAGHPPVDFYLFPDLWQPEAAPVNVREADLAYSERASRPIEGRAHRGFGEDLAHMDLRALDLENQDLTDADLRGADLRRTRLWGACLRRARLEGADLREADLTLAIVKGAYYDDGTRWPAGFDPQARGAVWAE
jgi:uncharacterized protein YjbI with pentapeptide repeats